MRGEVHVKVKGRTWAGVPSLYVWTMNGKNERSCDLRTDRSDRTRVTGERDTCLVVAVYVPAGCFCSCSCSDSSDSLLTHHTYTHVHSL